MIKTYFRLQNACKSNNVVQIKKFSLFKMLELKQQARKTNIKIEVAITYTAEITRTNNMIYLLL